MMGYLSLWPLTCSPFACSSGCGDSSPGRGLGVFRQMDFRPRSASFNLFKRRLHSNRHLPQGSQWLDCWKQQPMWHSFPQPQGKWSFDREEGAYNSW